MALEILTFRSLFRNTRTELSQRAEIPGGGPSGALVLQVAVAGGHRLSLRFSVGILRHLRFFSEPTWGFVDQLERVDGFVQIFTPTIYLTDVLLLAGLTYLLARRLANPTMRYLSLAADYFPLFLILGIGITGVLLRYVYRTDVTAVKELAIGLVTLHPVVPAGISPLFFVHLFLVSVLFAYFPFSKLMHMPGVFLSPTRNMANNNRWVHYENPWNYPVKYHTYMDQENEYREAMYEAGIPVEIPPESAVEKEK
jgi:nitrate reductase gamma subunit